MPPVFLFAAIGPNPASISEAIYALYRQRGLCVVEAHLVSLARGHEWLDAELLGEGGILAELRATLPGVLPVGEAAVHERVARLPTPQTEPCEGAAIVDDSEPAAAAAYRATMWEHARRCLDRAGAGRPVIFLLAGGRARTMTAYATTMYQLLARADDELMDIRVSDRRVEGGTGFYYPEQSQSRLIIGGEVVDASEVEVRLLPVEVPRLAGLLSPDVLTSYDAALDASRSAIAAAAPPRLVIDFVAGHALIDRERVPFSAAQLIWYGLLAAKRVSDADPLGAGAPRTPTPSAHDTTSAVPRGAVPSDAFALLREILSPIAQQSWVKKVRDYNVRLALGLDPLEGGKSAGEPEPERFNKLRADTSKTVRSWLAKKARHAWAGHLVPQKHKHDGQSHQRLALPTSHIVLRWPAS